MEEYLKLLLEQIRCKKAHPYIKEELQQHIEEQIKDNMLMGMSKEDAEKSAVNDMGSPVEAGILLDKIHKPQVAWTMIVLMALISIAAIIFHQIICSQIAAYSLANESTLKQVSGSSDFVWYTITGFVFMLLIYHIDYIVIARFAKVLAIALLGISTYGILSENWIYGMHYYVSVFGINISQFSLLMMYVPLYGAILYKYHGKGYTALIKSIIWMIIPAFIAFRLPSLSLAVLLIISMSVVLTVAIVLGWFKVARKWVLAILWGCEFVLPLALLTLAYTSKWLCTYQIVRIQAFFTGSGDANYITNILRANFLNSQLWGDRGQIWAGYIPNYNSDFIFSYLISTYGLFIGLILCCAFAFLVIKIFSISFKQKNQLGMCMGCGCGMIILLNVIINISENIGIIPITTSFFPFFSTGGSNIIMCYILMGIILSIYRYKNIYPSHVKTKLIITRKTINL